MTVRDGNRSNALNDCGWSKSEWGVPDWRCDTHYPLHTQEDKWRWEFLRRLPAYRDQWRNRPADWEETIYPEFRELWGINHLLDPAKQEVDIFGFWYRPPETQEFFIPRDYLSSANTDIKIPWKEYGPMEAFLKFDLSRNIASELKRAGKLLRLLQGQLSKPPGNRKHTPEALVRQLRALDAKDARAKNEEIGELLCPPHRGADAVSEAKRLVRTAKGVQLKYACKWHLIR